MTDLDPDERMDARLQRAGVAWRAAAPPAPSAIEPAAEFAPDAGGSPVLGNTAAVTNRRRRGPLLLSAAAVVAALVLGGVFALHAIVGDGTESGHTYPLRNTVWRLLGYGSDPRDDASSATLVLGSDGRLVADDTCAVVGARIEVDAASLRISTLDVRDRACSDPGGQTTFTRALPVFRSTPRYAVVGDELTIGRGSSALHLTAWPDAVPPTLDVPTLQGTTWALAQVLNPAGHPVAVSGSPALTIRGGTLAASDGCNALTAEVTVTGATLVLGRATNTGKPCTTATNFLVDDVLGNGTLPYTIAGGELTIRQPGGVTLVYRWVPTDAAATDPAALTGRTWYLTTVAGDPATDPTSTLRIAVDGTVSSQEVCLPARAGVGRGVLRLSGSSQDPDCGSQGGPVFGGQPSMVQSALTGPLIFAVRDGALVIGQGQGARAQSLVYRARPATGRSTLPGTTWTRQESATTLTFGVRGILEVRVPGACAPGSGAYEIDGDTLASTARQPASPPCATTTLTRPQQAAQAAQRPVLAGFLDRGSHWAITGDTLTLSRGGKSLTFRRA